MSVKAFTANLLDYRLTESFDILFSSGSLHYVPEGMRQELFENYKRFTNLNGLWLGYAPLFPADGSGGAGPSAKEP